MGLIGCPLCCRHEFVSVVALHDHLLYYTYRPLRCAVCGSNAAGIQELIHHLAQHLGDNISVGAQKYGADILPIKSQERDGNSENNIMVLQNKTVNKEIQYDCSNASRTQNHEYTNFPGREELTLCAYVCNFCGAKVVGKDKYIFHIKQHNNTLPDADPLQTAPSIIHSAPQNESCESEMAIHLHNTIESYTHSNQTNDQEAFTPSEPDLLDKTFSISHEETSLNYMEENDTATQLLKLREWQLEKLGKRYKKHRQSFTKSPGLSEQSSMSGRLPSNTNSPITNSQQIQTPLSHEHSDYSLDRQPLSLNSSASSADFEQPQTIYKELPVREHMNNSNSKFTGKTLSKEAPYDCVPLMERNRQGEKECIIQNPRVDEDGVIFKTAMRISAENISNKRTSKEDSHLQTSFTNLQKTQLLNVSINEVEINQASTSTYPIQESINIEENMSHLSIDPKEANLKISSTGNQENFNVVRDNSEASHNPENREKLYTNNQTTTQRQDFQIPSNSANSDVPDFREACGESEIQPYQPTQMNESLPSDSDLHDSLRTMSESSKHANPVLDNASSILVTDSWISPHETAQYLELEPSLKPQGSWDQSDSSRPIADVDTVTHKSNTNEQMKNVDNSPQDKRNFVQSLHNNVEFIEKPALGSERVSPKLVQRANTLTTIFTQGRTSSTAEDFLQCPNVSELDVIHDDPDFSSSTNYLNIVRNSDFSHNYNEKNTESVNCKNEIFPGHSSNSLPYLHKKFHHDQERKVASTSGGQNTDLSRYIHNFQSLLVSRLNGTFSVDTPFNPENTEPDVDNREEEEAVAMLDHAEMQKLSNKNNICEVCNFECPDSLQLDLHYKTHEQGDQKNFTCKFCKISFFKKALKDRHEKKHLGKKIYRCSQCQQVFNKLYILNRHLKEVHAVKRAFQCSVCGKDFTTSRHLQNHMGIHERERKHKCKHCEHSCQTASGLRTHIMELHSGPRDQNYSCKVCGELFSKQYGLKRHMERKHRDETLSCNICSKLFSCNEDLIKHRKSHESKDELSCKYCNQHFTSAWSLQRHSKKHQSDDNQFKCSKCSKVFTRKDSLVSHEKLHMQKRNYVCKCGKRFIKKSQLKAHEDKHSTLPKYSCDICRHSYKFKVSLRNHSCKPKFDESLNTDQTGVNTN